MEIKNIGSGSSGNCYLVTGKNGRILLDCGVSIKQIKVALKFKLSDIEGCFITHEHNDHCKSVKDLEKLGIECIATPKTKDIINCSRIININNQFHTNNFIITALMVNHDAVEPVAYYVKEKCSNETLLYITDTNYIPYTNIDVNYLMIETNYDVELLDNAISTYDTMYSLANRIINSHLSIDKAISFIQGSINLSSINEVYLIHLSSTHSNPTEFKERIQKITGRPVKVFLKGGKVL